MTRVDTPRVWVELLVRLPDEQTDRVLGDGVGPLLAAGRQAGWRGLFLREPAGPGHTRLIVQAQRPAGSVWTWDDRVSELSRRLGRSMLVRPAEHVPLAGSTFVGDDLAPVARDFLASATPILIGMVRSDAANRAGLLSNALDLMIGHLPAVSRPASDGVPLSFLSFRSHAEAFLASSRDPAAARSAFDRRYESVRDVLEGRTRGILGEFAGNGRSPTAPASAAAHGWYRAVRAAKPLVTEHFRVGRLDIMAEPDSPTAGRGFAASSFHNTLATASALRQLLRNDPSFRSVRLLTSLLYLSLHNLGLSLVERYFLCYAVSRACESLFDVTAIDVLSGFAAQVATMDTSTADRS